MKVGFISFHSFLQPGGVKRHILGLSKEFRKRGIETKIIVPRRDWRENYGKDVILLGTSFPINFGGSSSDLDINFNQLSIERILRKEKFDILHFHNFTLPSTVQILASPYTANTLNISTFHSDMSGSKFLKNFPFWISFINTVFNWRIDGLIGVAQLILKSFKRYNGPQIVIPNGIDLDKFNSYRPKIKRFLDGKINILFLGRIEERKGLIYLLKAYKILQRKFSNLRLIVGGEGPLKNDMEEWAKENNLKNVVFEGKVKEDTAPFYYSSCDIFCAPSIFGESFGLVLLEAMACGKPVIAFANNGYKEFLKGKKEEEFLVRPKDYRELARKLEILIKNKKLREVIGKTASKEAKEYSWRKIADRVLNFYAFCRKKKAKEKKEDLYFDKFINKLDGFLNKDISDWL